MIVITHYFGTFYGAQGFVSAVTFSPDLHLSAANWVHYLDFPYLKGPFGVALFFLISGFVIPFSLEGQRIRQFLLCRAFRIFPTYFLALCLSMAVLYLSSRYWNQGFTHELPAILANGLLIHNLVGIASIDPINWTLSIEVKFYLLAAACAPLFTWRSFVGIALLSVAILAGIATASMQDPGPALAALAMEMNYILFMLIGVLFYQHFSGAFGYFQLIGRSAFVLGVFAFAWSIGSQQDQFPHITAYYCYAYAAFFVAYMARDQFRPLWLPDFLADISYPLYITHSLMGFAVLKILLHKGVAFPYAVAAAVLLAIVFSAIIHHVVELPSNALGKRLSARYLK